MNAPNRTSTLRVVAATAAVGILASNPTARRASADSDGFTVEIVPVTEMRHAVDLTWRDSDPAVYIARQDGYVERIDEREPLGASDTVLDVSDLTVRDNEQGFLGLTFAPDGEYAYVNYTDLAGDTVIAEYAVGDDGVFDESSARIVLTVDQPEVNHNGGDLAFGPDGMLYIGMGDGGGYGDPDRTAQNLSLLLGKMLRIDPAPSDELGYTVPDDNPFAGVDGARPEIWALGLRNPWRFSFDALTGDLWIADVGEGSAEEVNVAPATDGRDAGRARNFGWSAFEATEGFHGGLADSEHSPPIYQYAHDNGRCSVSGGTRARGDGSGALEGWFLFGDWCAGALYALEVSGNADDMGVSRVVEIPEAATERLTAVVSGQDGSIYVLGDRSVSRLVVS